MTLTPALGRQTQTDYCKSEASLVYMADAGQSVLHRVSLKKKKEERIEGRKQNLIDSLIKVSYQTDSQTFIPLKFLKDGLPVVVKNGTVGRRDGSAGKRDCHHSEDTTLIPGPHTVEERIHTRRPPASTSTPTHCIINTQNATGRYTSLRVG